MLWPLRLDADLREWGLDPEVYPDFETRVMQGFIDLILAKRRRWKERGHLHYEKMTEQELLMEGSEEEMITKIEMQLREWGMDKLKQ